MNVNDEFPKDEHNNDENIDDHDDIEEDNDKAWFIDDFAILVTE